MQQVKCNFCKKVVGVLIKHKHSDELAVLPCDCKEYINKWGKTIGKVK